MRRSGGGEERTGGEALEADDVDVDVGVVLGGPGDLVGAEAAYRRGDERGEASAAYNLGALLHQRGDLVGAEAAYHRGDERGDPMAAYGLGFLLAERGDLVGAEAAYRRGDERGDPMAAHGLGFLLEERGDLLGAEAAYRRADERGNAPAAGNLGVLLYQRREFVGAEAAFRRGDERGDGRAVHGLGVLLAERGDREEAEAAHRRAGERGHSIPASGVGKERTRLIGLLVGVALALKSAVMLVPKLGFASTAISMVVSIGAYAFIWDWKFAVGIVLLLLVHEYGHVLQLRREGIAASAPMFIPFVGALVAMRELPKDAAAEARVGLAGPVLGTLGTLVPLAAWQLTDSELMQALTYVGFFINLFNLVPVLPLDGGRAMAAVSPKLWALGFAAMLALTVITLSPLMVLIVLFGAMEAWSRFKHRKAPARMDFHKVGPRARFTVLGVYIGLLAVTGYGAHGSYLDKDFDDVGRSAPAVTEQMP